MDCEIDDLMSTFFLMVTKVEQVFNQAEHRMWISWFRLKHMQVKYLMILCYLKN